MSRISVFNFVSIDGFFAGPNGEIDWFHSFDKDEEWEKFSNEASGSGNSLMFGHTTYEMMKSYWPTPDALKTDPVMAEVMNKSPKIVFSGKLKSVKEEGEWKNIKLFHEIDPVQVKKLKDQQDITILGSGSIIRQLENLDLIDEYMLLVIPVILGSGKSFFTNVKKKNFKLLNSRNFGNGSVLLHYKTKPGGD